MSDIKPALSRDEWERREIGERLVVAAQLTGEGAAAMIEVTEDLRWFRDDDIPALIALANAALLDTDPREITQAMVEDIRHAAAEVALKHPQLDRLSAALDRHADALESYLPPEDA